MTRTILIVLALLLGGCATTTQSVVTMKGFGPNVTSAVMKTASEFQSGLCPTGKVLEERRAEAKPERRNNRRYLYITPPRTEVSAKSEIQCSNHR